MDTKEIQNNNYSSEWANKIIVLFILLVSVYLGVLIAWNNATGGLYSVPVGGVIGGILGGIISVWLPQIPNDYYKNNKNNILIILVIAFAYLMYYLMITYKYILILLLIGMPGILNSFIILKLSRVILKEFNLEQEKKGDIIWKIFLGIITSILLSLIGASLMAQ